MTTLRKFDKIFLISLILAIFSCCFVPIDKQYLSYFDFKTLFILFIMMLVVGGFRNIKIFDIFSREVIKKLKNTKSIIFFLVAITFLGDMILANDISLITFIPLTIAVFKDSKYERYIPFVIVMQVIAADLGGMITPFGNPQNLYLYSKFSLSPLIFVKIMFKPFIISLILMVIFLMFLSKNKMNVNLNKKKLEYSPKVYVYLVLFILIILMIFRLIPLWMVAIIVIPTMLIMDVTAFKKVDYTLILTFCTLFVLSGNVARLEIVKNFANNFLSGNELLVEIGFCQVLSNVPTTILLSNFTNKIGPLLIGVNIGSLGTLIASMASIIAYRQFASEFKNRSREYILIFTTINIAFLVLIYIGVKIFCNI